MTNHLPGKFIIPISGIYVSDAASETLGLDRITETVKRWHPNLIGYPSHLIHTFRPSKFKKHGNGGWVDDIYRDKVLVILCEGESIPPNMESDFILEHFRPWLTLWEKPDNSGALEGVLKHRALIVPGAKGHAHAPYGPDGRMEDVIFVPGRREEMTTEEYKTRYRTFLPSLKITT
jgi:hypothetical protein